MHTVQPETVGLSTSRLQRIRPAMRSLVEQGHFAGISTLVYRQGHVAWFDCQGYADLASGTPLAPDALYRIYSMTKPITAVATMMLWERGLFGLYDPISAYIPSFYEPSVLVDMVAGQPRTEPAKREITIHDLLTHTSGLVYEFDETPLGKIYGEAGLDGIRNNHSLTTAMLVNKLAQMPLAFTPASSWRYGYAQDVLGRLIEVVSGLTFGEFLREKVFEPLGMHDTDFWVPNDKLDRLTSLYLADDRGGLASADIPTKSQLGLPASCESGGGGLISTMADYLQFARLLLGKGQVDGVQLLGRRTVEMMTANHLVGPQLAAYQADGRPGMGYGLGMGVTLDPQRDVTHASAGDFGWGGAASTWFRVDPREEMIVLIMSQVLQSPDRVHVDRFRTMAYAALT